MRCSASAGEGLFLGSRGIESGDRSSRRLSKAVVVISQLSCCTSASAEGEVKSFHDMPSKRGTVEHGKYCTGMS